MPFSTIRPTRVKKTTGLRYWMLRVLDECEHVSADFAPDPVHDLRVSLRRCRSLADGLLALDPDPNWKAMKKAGKRSKRFCGVKPASSVTLACLKNMRASLLSIR